MAILTEKMAAILKSPEAEAIVQRLSPVYGEAYTALWIFEVLGREWDDLQKYSEEMLNQVVPQTATWLIPYWEDTYGVTRNENLAIEQRRQNVLNVIRTRGPANPYKLVHMVSSITGCPCELKERTGKNKFTIIIYADADPSNLNMAYSAIEALKPAHLIFDTYVEEKMPVRANVVASMTNYSAEALDSGYYAVLPAYHLKFGGSITGHSEETMNSTFETVLSGTAQQGGSATNYTKEAIS
jgi:hypothetical protein